MNTNNFNEYLLKFSNSYFTNTTQKYLKYLWQVSEKLTKKVFIFDPKVLVDKYDTRVYELICADITRQINYIDNTITAVYNYNKRNNTAEIVIWSTDMNNIYCIKMNYSERDNYNDFIFEVNNKVEDTGLVALFVNNNPYNLEYILCAETQQDISRIIKRYDLKQYKAQSFDELFDETINNRKYNYICLPKGINKTELNCLVDPMFFYKNQNDLFKTGLSGDVEYKKKKLFISYSHSDEKTVSEITELLIQKGFNCWIDKQDISVGENILQAVTDSLRECDIVLLFMSENYKNSFYAKHELNTIFNDYILKQKLIFPIKLDTVNPNDILYSLNNIKYLDYQKENSTDSLFLQLKELLEK